MKGKKANLSQFAHPRNPYKNGVGDLTALAETNPDFATVAKRNEAGKIITDWSDREYSKQLLKAVMKRDFNLDLNMPQGALAPALTNKFNYLLWIQDLAELNKIQDVKGIDIGTGAGLYFAALAARHFRWKMLATEANVDDFATAQDNISRNNLSEFIQLVLTDKHQLLRLPDGVDFFFTLCNPPYYEPHEEIRPRQEYQGSMSGRDHEISVSGGEVEFVGQIIDESSQVSNRVKIFSSMIGHKKNVSILKEKLLADHDIKSTSITELCQGRTMRWVLAWTYDPDIQLTVPSLRAEAKIKEKEKQPITFNYQTGFHCIDISTSLKLWLSSLNIDVIKEGKSSEKAAYLRLKTNKTDWRGQRAKRRAAQEIQEPSTKRPKMDQEDDDEEVKLDCQLYLNKDNDQQVTFQFIYLSGNAGKNGMAEDMDHYVRGSTYPREESLVEEFKGHRSFCIEELPKASQIGPRPSRQNISRYACGMLNSGKGGLILMGVLDTGRIEGFMMNKYQQDHVRLSIQDTFQRFQPAVPKHLYSVTFKPVIDSIEDLQWIDKLMKTTDDQDRNQAHLLRTKDMCWCDQHASAAFAHGILYPWFVIELQLQAWDSNDERNKVLFSDDAKVPKFKAENGNEYVRNFASNISVTQHVQTSN